LAEREDRWSEAVAVGSLAFVEKVKEGLGGTMHRAATEVDGTFTCGKKGKLTSMFLPAKMMC
jgi:hypothetical protein